MSFVKIFLLNLFIININYFANSDEDHNREWLKGLIPGNYNRLYLPIDKNFPNRDGFMTLRITPSAITSVSIKNMDFSIESKYYIYWWDHRLKPTNNITKEKVSKYKKSKITTLALPLGLIEVLWKPSTLAFRNCKKCHQYLIPDEKTGKLIIYIGQYNAGVAIFTSYRKTMEFICTFNLKSYPFDVQECSIDIEMGKRYSDKKLFVRNVRLLQHDIEIPPEYKLLSIKLVFCEKNVNYSNSNGSPLGRHNHYCYSSVFRLRRNINSFIILIYIPSALIVLISCLSFWLDPEVAPPRVAIGLTSLLTLATQFNNAQKDLPPVAYIKALDIWMFFCMFFVFATLIEFTAVNFLLRRKKAQTNKVHNLAVQNYFNSLTIQKANKKNTSTKEKNWGIIIDRTAMVWFPISFFIFNTLYWTIYIRQYYYYK